MPIECAVEMHVKPVNRKTHVAHSVAGFHVGTSMEHYRGQKVYVTETDDIQIADTIFYNYKYLTMSTRTKADAIEDEAKDLKNTIEGGVPQSNMDGETLNKLMDIFRMNAEV